MATTFLEQEKPLWTNTLKLKEIVGREAEFDAVYFVGGHGRTFPSFWLLLALLLVIAVSDC